MHTDRNLNAKNSTFITYFKQLRTNQRTQKSRNILPETTRPCNKRFTTHCYSVRHLAFFKSTSTNSRTLGAAEAALDLESEPQTPARCSTRGDSENACLDYFFNWKTHTEKLLTISQPLHDSLRSLRQTQPYSDLRRTGDIPPN